MNQQSTPPSHKQVCKVCRKPIEFGAKICTECKSYQNWRRHFSFSTVVLSLIIALISVSTTAFQVVTDLLAEEQSDIRFSLVKYGPDSITIMSSNLGDRAGALRSATLRITMPDDVKTYKLHWKDVDLVVKPESWRLFQMIPMIHKNKIDLQLLPYSVESCTHSIEFDVLAFDHNPKNSTITYKCPAP